MRGNPRYRGRGGVVQVALERPSAVAACVYTGLRKEYRSAVVSCLNFYDHGSPDRPGVVFCIVMVVGAGSMWTGRAMRSPHKKYHAFKALSPIGLGEQRLITISADSRRAPGIWSLFTCTRTAAGGGPQHSHHSGRSACRGWGTRSMACAWMVQLPLPSGWVNRMAGLGDPLAALPGHTHCGVNPGTARAKRKERTPI